MSLKQAQLAGTPKGPHPRHPLRVQSTQMWSIYGLSTIKNRNYGLWVHASCFGTWIAPLAQSPHILGHLGLTDLKLYGFGTLRPHFRATLDDGEIDFTAKANLAALLIYAIRHSGWMELGF